MIEGQCACGAIRFHASPQVVTAHHCHCDTCRSIHGTVYGSTAVVPREGFEVTSGSQHVRDFESSPGKRRCFCALCGTHVFVDNDHAPETMTLRIGTLQADHGIRPLRHIWVQDKADWYEITDTLPRNPGQPD